MIPWRFTYLCWNIPILLQKQVSKASIAKIVGVSLPPPLYQGKAVTPTPLKDIFTPIWAGPWFASAKSYRNSNVEGTRLGSS